jgi:two-component system sensor histidine kinase GlrK
MKKFQSPTLLGFVLIGFILVALPLVASIITSISQVDRLARESELTILTVQQNAVVSKGLVERITSMERSARQYQALGDATFKDLYDQHREGATTQLTLLSNQVRNQQLMAAVERVIQAENQLTRLLDSPPGAIDAGQLEVQLNMLQADTAAVVREQNLVSQSMAGVLSDKVKELKKALAVQAGLVISASAGLMAILFIVIAHPLRQIGHSIRALGRGALGEPIRVEGARDLEELGQRLEWLRNRLVELESQKSQFLRNVSHELKTPLTSIREGAELLLEDINRGRTDDLQLVAQIIQSNSIRLQRMIEALLRHGAEGDLTAGQPDVPLRLDNLVLEIIERHSPDAAARNIRLEHHLTAAVVIGNVKRLQIIFENLLSNALKYTPRDGVIGVRLREREDGFELEVRDSGSGIAEEDRDQVFEWFFAGPRPPESIVAGSGMGLAIAREYAEKQQGRLELVPTTKGAQFRLTLKKAK